MRTYTPDSAVLVPEHAAKVFEGVIYTVYQWEQEQFDGSVKTFEMIKRPDTVQILAIHDNKMILSQESQPHVGDFLSIPTGMHDVLQEDELAAAKRELKEETGHIFKSWKLIQTASPSNKIEQVIYTFVATDLDTIAEPQLDAGEKIELIPSSFEEIKKLKDAPRMRFYPSAILDNADSFEALLTLPSLYNYEN